MVFNETISAISGANPMLAAELVKSPWLLYVIIAQVVLKLIFYPIALYFAGSRKQGIWFGVLFVALFLLNDFAVLAITYIVVSIIIEKKAQKITKKVSKRKK